MSTTWFATQNEVFEWSFRSNQAYPDPFNALELDVVLTHASGQSWRVPAFWGGDQTWRVRFAPPLAGSYQFVTVCTDAGNPDLHGQSGALEAAPYTGGSPLLIHGPLQVAASGRTLQYADGIPFFWLADTWWMALCKRLRWPDEFQALAADRLAKGFTTVQIVAGLYPDMPGFDPRGANEAGFPWEENYARINPAYFDMADLRIRWLTQAGLVPCIVGCWGYYLPLLGIEKMKQHWRYLVARWSAYPVFWCLAGEANMPYYLSADKPGDEKLQKTGWTELGRYVRAIDPYHRLTGIHPTQVGRDQVEDDTVLDFNMLQTGHGGYNSISNSVEKVIQQRQRQPAMPVLVSEVSYEGIIHDSQPEIQRLVFWASMLSGAMGHTYGANGIWQLNGRGQPYGASPWGGNWGNTPWDEAAQLPGSRQLGLAKRLLERYPWQRFEPHPEWVQPSGSPSDINAPFAAGIPGEVRVVYFYNPQWQPGAYAIQHLEAGVSYRACFWNPRDGEQHDLGLIQPQPDGCWKLPLQPTQQDWVLILERASS